MKLKSASVFSNNKELWLLLFSLLIAITVFLKNAWVTEDAYISFRSIEQLFAGNGPIWNPHERVQVFTSPLWFWVLSFVRIFSSDVYLNAIIVSLILWLSTILILHKLINNNKLLLIAILLFTASTGFYDYTSSGLENPLAYFIIALYIFYYIKLFEKNKNIKNIDTKTNKKKEQKVIRILLFLFSLIICVRHDLILIFLPASLYILWQKWNVFNKKKWILVLFVSFLPIILWTLFSLIYYGFPFPNTAYAKLNTGIPKLDLIEQGGKYFLASLKSDFITLFVIFTSLIIVFKNSRKKFLKALSFGVIFNLLYILYVGGDFMQGRFFSYSFLISVVLLVLNINKNFLTKKTYTLSYIFISLFLFFYPHTPLNSPITYSANKYFLGIADERAYYFEYLSLNNYILDKNKKEYFPLQVLSRSGYRFNKSTKRIIIKKRIGLFGYWAGIEKILIDRLALSDPLLARMHIKNRFKKKWRIGHFARNIPEGYIKSIKKGNEIIVNKNINEYYKKLKIITENKKLFTIKRLKTILLMNLGKYDYLLDTYAGDSKH